MDSDITVLRSAFCLDRFLSQQMKVDSLDAIFQLLIFGETT